MKRSEINRAYRDARAFFAAQRWALPREARWDITDFGLGDFARFGLTLVTLANEAEYCEKIMVAWRGQTTPCHCHRRKKEDIICRAGELTVRLWAMKPGDGNAGAKSLKVSVNGRVEAIAEGGAVVLAAGSRVTIAPGVWHEFFPTSDECLIGEVSTANDDEHDNFFLDARVGRFPGIEEDEPAAVRLLSEK